MLGVCNNGYITQRHVGNMVMKIKTTTTNVNMTNVEVFSTVKNDHYIG